MMIRLAKLLLQRGARVVVASLATLCIAGVLYFVATHVQSEKRTFAEASAKPIERKHLAVQDLP
jgi:hypothetical protein